MVTMQDIATHVGISQATVSLVLNKRHAKVGIAEDTVRRVLEAAEELGYRRNNLARAVVTGKYNAIGLIRGSHTEQSGQLLAGVLEEAQKYDHSVKVIHSTPSLLDRETIDNCLQMRLAGFIGVHIHPSTQQYLQQEAARCDIPLVFLDNSAPEDSQTGIRVNGNDQEATQVAVEHLISLGHRRIAFIGGYAGGAMLRERGYRIAMKLHGLSVPDKCPLSSYYDDATTETVTRELLQLEKRPTAIVCISDLMAMVVCRTARKMGFSVPQDLSVIGYDNIDAASRADPPLTTLAQPFEEMGRIAVQHLMDAATGNSETPGVLNNLIEARLVVRESTGPAPS